MEILESCPAALLYKTPIVSEVIEAHRWAKLGQPLKDLYPSGIPAVIVNGMLGLDAGLQQAELERIEERERNRQAANRKNSGGDGC